jgi:ribosomal protein S18 acetylase RimI-like enzyme
MDSLTLRTAGPDDGEFAFDVKRAAFKEYVAQVHGWDEAEQRRLHDQRFGSQEFRIIHVAGTDVGIMAVDVAPDRVRVNQLFLLPEHQGRGIGRACMLRIMEEARQLGLPVRLQVMKVNPRALAFYERLGFTHVGSTETHDQIEWDGQSSASLPSTAG